MTKEIKIKVQCVLCGEEKEVGEGQKEQPMCDKCFGPMITIGAKISLKD